MDMDLWWCPVCERAITEQEETVQRPSLPKRATLPPSPPRYTSRGGVYGPKGSLYCSEACREVEELNGRFAFEQLAACLPSLLGRPSLSEEPESEGTFSSTDELNTDRSRSLSLGRRSHSTAINPRSPICSDELSLKPCKSLIPSKAQRGPRTSKDFEPAPANRRIPILISPNGTSLIQPTFPQRPPLSSQQRRHHSHHSPRKRCSPQSSAVTRTSCRAKLTPLSGPPKASNSVPTYPSSAAATQNTVKSTTKTILSHQPKGRNDMEFGADARREKPTSLLRHYGLFFRSRPGSKRDEWIDSADEPDSVAGLSVERKALATGLSRQPSQTGSQNSRRSSVQLLIPMSTAKTQALEEKVEPQLLKRASPRKERKHALGENSCRSWTWDHLPADVPQYPAMDLAQIRHSKLLRQQAASSLPPLQPSSNTNNSQLLTHPPPTQLSFNHMSKIQKHIDLPAIPPDSISSFPIIQSKKKLFIFQ